MCVMNTPGQNSNAVAELAFGMMVMAVRNFYNGTSGTELMGKKLGIHAYGNVAVSYTHLDVYKRQDQICAAYLWCRSLGTYLGIHRIE